MKIFLDQLFPLDDAENSARRKIQLAAKALATVIQESCADSAQRDQAILKVREACLVACDVVDNRGNLTPSEVLRSFLKTSVLDVAHSLRPNSIVIQLTMNPKDWNDILKNAWECLEVESRRVELMKGLYGSIDMFPAGSRIQLFVSKAVAEGTYLATFENGGEPVLIEADSPFRAARLQTRAAALTRFERPEAS